MDAWTARDWARHTVGAVVSVGTSFALGMDIPDGYNNIWIDPLLSDAAGYVAEEAFDSAADAVDATNKQENDGTPKCNDEFTGKYVDPETGETYYDDMIGLGCPNMCKEDK